MAELGAPVVESIKEVGGDGLAGFDFHCLKGVWPSFDEGIDFMPLLVAEEMKTGLDAPVGLGFEEFSHHPVFKQGSALRVGSDVADIPHA